MNAALRSLREITRYPSAAGGLVIILGLILLSIYTVVTIPYEEAIRRWRGDDLWQDYPKNAQPAWSNWFRVEELPKTIILDSAAAAPGRVQVSKSTTALSEDLDEILITFQLDYPYDGFPQEINLFFTSRYAEKQPNVALTWISPDGRETKLGDFSIGQEQSFRFAQEERLVRKLGGAPETILFSDPAASVEGQPAPALKGAYRLEVSALVFENDSDVDARLVVYGQVHGLAGTDHRRRDLMVALLWGTPIALAFGLLAALGTTLVTMIIAAVGVWFGGMVDEAIQRITEVNLILPFLPILIMVGTLYSRSIWTMLGVSILLSIFGAAIKGYRAIFMQVKESPYIEAARAYGAGDLRIIFLYLIPRIIPVLIPQLVNVIPTFVFLEASLAVLGLGDPVLPTWGKVIDDARANGALFQGQYYWVLEPSVLLMLTGLAFAMVGFALDRVFNPKLREV
jgi:peptide/nickel transport system permease protein